MINQSIGKIVIKLTLATVFLLGGITCLAETKPTNGDGSGIGGTGNAPGGSGLGGTGAREQQLPDTMPDLPETPDTADMPDIQVPETPEGIDTNGANELPDTDIPAAH